MFFSSAKPCVLNTRTQYLWKKQMFDVLQFGHRGIFQGQLLKVQFMSNNWLGFWHFHMRQWGGFMLHVKHLDFLCEIV
jgi:hypothetical protein